jgi:glycosyltransferase involved in cell wall biosynthesis
MSRRVDISIVTPCFNMAATIEATIQSVIEARKQGVNLEYIVIDGGSTDGTLEAIARYENDIDVIASDSRQGQYAAINQGMSLATGPLLAWINADDVYFRWTLKTVVALFRQFATVRWMIGLPTFINKDGVVTEVASQIPAYPRRLVRRGAYRTSCLGYLQQESMFWRRDLWDEVGGLQTRFHLAADYDLWRRFSEHADLVSIAVPLAAFRRRIGQRSVVMADEYKSDVRGQVRHSRVWETIGQRFRLPRALARSVMWSRGPVIYYEEVSQTWRLVRRWRPLSRRSFGGLVFEAQRQAGKEQLSG